MTPEFAIENQGWSIQHDKVWGPSDIGLFRQCLRFLPHDIFATSYYGFDTDGNVTARDGDDTMIRFAWLKSDADRLVGINQQKVQEEGWGKVLTVSIGIMKTSLEELYSSGLKNGPMELYSHWVSHPDSFSAVRYGDGTLRTLGRLALMDFMRFILETWIRDVLIVKDGIRSEGMSRDQDRPPFADDYHLRVLSKSEKVPNLLESLDLSTTTKYRPDSSSQLELIAEILALLSEDMKQHSREIRDLRVTIQS